MLLSPKQALSENLDIEEHLTPLEPFSPLNMKEEVITPLDPEQPAPNILDQIFQNITLQESLSMILHENRERRFFITVPTNVLRIVMNIRTYPFSIFHKYDVLVIPTLTKEDITMNIGADHPMVSHLRMSLAPDGSSRIVITDQEIHVNIQVSSITNPWLLSLVYASTSLANRRILWNNLEQYQKTIH